MEGTVVPVGLISIVIVLIELIKYMITKIMVKKNGNGVVKIHPEITRQIRSSYESLNLLTERDIKMIQSHQEKMSETFANIGKSLERIAEHQERTARTLEKIDRRQEVEEEVRRALP